jgi:3-oxoacyl-[acyl-carrier protein] reductase
MSLTGYRALVCGASRGIGRAAATALAEAGADVVLLARDMGGLEKAKDSLPRSSSHDIIAIDLSNPNGTRSKMAEWAASRPPIHILINNAGGPPPGPLLDAQQEALEAAFATHVLSSQALVQVLVPGMKSEKYGRIINVISTSVREPIRNLGVSNTIRASMAGWSKTLSRELAPYAITVNNILPGSTLTDRHRSLVESRAKQANTEVSTIEKQMLADIPMGRFAAPEEVAAAIAFLASPSAGYITGVNLPVDGGRISAI